ncbi:MAG: DNA polymerase I [Alphaproteobacteria bacterium]|nr:DNA polymerase I [Alphaproteobacteria bacterium]MBV8548122.1 DNA polymerase I [Alphaproteobacteria bacterium]
MTTLYLVDGSGFIFRAFHALPDLTRADGTHVGAVMGFCNMLQKLLADAGGDHVAVIFDAARQTFRNDIYPEYKAHRPPPPPELIPQFALIREATRAFGLPAIDAPNYEADDLIASYAREAVAAGWDVRIVSSDKDLMQLIRDHVALYDPLKSIPIGTDEVLKKFGVTPDKVVDVQALAGDSTDNVPGVPGIGVKTAAELINTYGSLEALLERATEIKQPKRREALIENAELARISQRLVRLDDQAPLPMPLADLKRLDNHRETLVEFLRTQGFRSILARLGETAPAPTPVTAVQTAPAAGVDGAGEVAADDGLQNVASDYELVQDLQRLKDWVAAARDTGRVAIDTETDSLRACTAKLVGISLAVAAGRACYIPVGHIDPKSVGAEGGFVFDAVAAPKQIPLSQVADALRDLLADDAVLKIGHNLKYDMQVLAQHNLIIRNYDDTMLLSYVQAAGAHGHGLDELAKLHFNHAMIAYDDVTGTGKQKVTFDRVPLDQATAYAAEDADYAFRLWLRLKPKLAQEHLVTVYERIERPLVPVVAAMEQTGICIDPDELKRQSQALAVRLQKLEEEIHGMAGHAFNVGSPKQLGDVLFAEMGLPGGVKGKTGAYSTSSDVLEPLAEQGHDIVARVLEWRGAAKLKSTYTDALPEQIAPQTGRVHTSFNLVGAATGRLSSNDPNLQNIPIRTEDGRAIRRAFVAAPGHELLSVDYSQIELRLAAEAAGIKALIQAFHDGVDIHALTASQVFGIPLADLPPDRRRAAKAINFGIIYGISGFGLAKQIGITQGEANQFIRQYLDRFHELRDWMEATKSFARDHGYVQTLFGRRIYINAIRDKMPARRAGAERAAINAPLQGTAADIMKRAMIRVGPALAEARLSARLLLQVHDELVFEVPVAELERTSALVKQVMQEAPLPALTLRVPITAEAGHAKNWAEAH